MLGRGLRAGRSSQEQPGDLRIVQQVRGRPFESHDARLHDGAPIGDGQPGPRVLLNQSTVTPEAFSSRTVSNTTRRALGSSPIEGSSISTNLGSSIMARAISTIFCSPPDREPARSAASRGRWGTARPPSPAGPARPPDPAGCTRRSARCPTRSSAGRGSVPAARATTPHDRTSRGERPEITSPSSVTVPSRGRSRPLRTFSTVDFPAPLGPITHVMDASGTCRSTPLSTSPCP